MAFRWFIFSLCSVATFVDDFNVEISVLLLPVLYVYKYFSNLQIASSFVSHSIDRTLSTTYNLLFQLIYSQLSTSC
jgi:hypothetical protein